MTSCTQLIVKSSIEPPVVLPTQTSTNSDNSIIPIVLGAIGLGALVTIFSKK